MARAWSSIRACSRARRSFLTAGRGRSRAGWPPACRGGAVDEAEKLWSKPISSISFIVASKSWSVSPGKPTMKSEDRLMSGRACAQLAHLRLYSSTVWPRFIAARMRSEPLAPAGAGG
jgi:hypothetical protein